MTSINDPAVQKALMENPEVQAAIKRAGQDALQNPEVQAKIFETCKKEFPGLANQAKDQCLEWAKDPEMQRKAQQYAGVAGAMAADYAGRAGGEFMSQIEQGPTGVRFLAFCGGAVSVGYAGYMMLGLLNPFNLLGGPVTYVICGYQLIFGLTATIFEMPPDYMAKVPGVNGYQDLLMQKAAFLSDVAGRGLFYIFVGSLWFALGGLSPVDLALGCYMTFIGFLHIAMHYGKLGVVTDKLKDGANAAKNKAEELRPLTGTQ